MFGFVVFVVMLYAVGDCVMLFCGFAFRGLVLHWVCCFLLCLLVVGVLSSLCDYAGGCG